MVFTGGMDAAGTNSSGLVSGEAVELELRVARIGSRAIALLLDVAAQAILLVILITAMVIFLLYAGYAGILDSALATGLMITMLVIVLIGYPPAADRSVNVRRRRGRNDVPGSVQHPVQDQQRMVRSQHRRS